MRKSLYFIKKATANMFRPHSVFIRARMKHRLQTLIITTPNNQVISETKLTREYQLINNTCNNNYIEDKQLHLDVSGDSQQGGRVKENKPFYYKYLKKYNYCIVFVLCFVLCIVTTCMLQSGSLGSKTNVSFRRQNKEILNE